MSSARSSISKIRRSAATLLRWCLSLLLLLFVMDIAYLAWIWPDWQSYQQGQI
jgi:hypothetical protein